MNRKLYFNWCFLLLLFIFAGCNAPKDQLMVFNEHFSNCDYQKSLDFAQSKISKGKSPAREDLLWALQAGSVERIMHNYPESTGYFDKSEEFLNYYDFQNETAGAVAATIVNENINPYAGEEYDGIMVNTYKALNFMVQHNDELARVEFNRALDRQRRAKETYAKEITKIKDDIAKQEQQGNAPIKKSIVDRGLVFEGNDSQDSALKLLYHTPESIPVLFLRLDFNRIF